jgi:hypothetical protein
LTRARLSAKSMIVILLAGMSMNFNTIGTAHWDTEPQPMMSNRPLNVMQNLFN